MIRYTDTHCHLDGEEFAADYPDVVSRARDAGCRRIFIPAVTPSLTPTTMQILAEYPSMISLMTGLHPEEVKVDNEAEMEALRRQLEEQRQALDSDPSAGRRFIAIGEIGLDFYWSRDFEKEQTEVFERQVALSAEYRLPLMIHCRKAQNEMVRILKSYERDLCGGVFHCFTGNAIEAEQLLSFDGFALGIGGVLTFKKSNLPETLARAVPLERIVLETDAPYMAPVPLRGTRNESANIVHVIKRLSEIYDVDEETVCRKTEDTTDSIFRV